MTTVTVQLVEPTVTVRDSGAITVTAVGIQGPAGASPLPPQTFTVGATSVGAQKLVALVDDVLELADASNLAHAGNVIGWTTESTGIGEDCLVTLFGKVDWDGEDLTPGTYFVGTAGTLSATPPLGAVFVQVAGKVLSASTFLVDIDSSVIIV